MLMSTRTVGLMLLVGLLLAPASASAAVILADTFTVDGTTRVVGQGVVGTFTEVGQAKWGGTGKFVFAAGDVLGYTGGAGAGTQSAPFTSTADPMILTIDFNFDGATGGSSFASAGFAAASVVQPYGNAINLFVFPNGNWVLRWGANSSTQSAGSGLDTAPGFHTLKVQYNPATKEATAWYDATLLATKTASGSDIPATIISGWFGTSGVSSLLVDNFSIAIVPEPMSLVLLALAGAVCLRRRC